MVPDKIATDIIVFGAGLVSDNTGIRLSSSSSLRVDALIGYIESNRKVLSRRGRIVLSGGWPGASEGMKPPSPEFREASFMLRRMYELLGEQGLSYYTDVDVEIESDSTLENVLRVKEQGYFDNVSFTPENPLGLVAQAAHLKRVDYLVRRVFRIQGDAIIHIVAPEPDNLQRQMHEFVLLTLTRIAFVGAKNGGSLRHRHRILVTAAKLLRYFR
jgi:DUF218 domain